MTERTTKSVKPLLYLRDRDGWWWCWDNKWRQHPHFGSTPECAKGYRSLGAAENRAFQLPGSRIFQLPEGLAPDSQLANWAFVAERHGDLQHFMHWLRTQPQVIQNGAVDAIVDAYCHVNRALLDRERREQAQQSEAAE